VITVFEVCIWIQPTPIGEAGAVARPLPAEVPRSAGSTIHFTYPIAPSPRVVSLVSPGRRRPPDCEPCWIAQYLFQTFSLKRVLPMSASLSNFQAAMSLLNHSYFNSVIGALVRHGVPDYLDDGPLAAAVLAQRAGIDALALTRALRALAAFGTFQ